MKNRLLLASGIIGILLLTGVVFFFRSSLMKDNQSSASPATGELQQTSTPSPDIKTPAKVVEAFFQAVQNKDKVIARTFLSPNAIRKAFQSTYEEKSTAGSLYTTSFNYNILETKIAQDKKTAFVMAEINVEGQVLKSTAFLENLDGNWLLTNLESLADPSAVPKFARPADQAANTSVVIVVDGPTEMYVTNPEGKHHGYDPVTQKYVEEIEDALYSPNTIYDQRSFSVTELTGVWKVQIIGKGTGTYTLGTQLVEKDNDETGFIHGSTSVGQIDTYLVKYPTQRGVPLEFTKVK